MGLREEEGSQEIRLLRNIVVEKEIWDMFDTQRKLKEEISEGLVLI